MSADTTLSRVLALAADLGSELERFEKVAWGDSGTTARLWLRDGRVLAARHCAGSDGGRRAATLAIRIERLHEAGVDVPYPPVVRPSLDLGAWLVTPWREGRVGAQLLGHPAGARSLAGTMGRLVRSVAGVSADGLDLPRTWADRDALHAAATMWLAQVDGHLDRRMRDTLTRAIADLRDMWTATPIWEPVVAHGDFAPINVLVNGDGRLVLVDVEDVQEATRLFDLAWWGWVVRYHHPAAWAAGWTELIDGAGIAPDATVDRAAGLLGLIRCLERTAQAPAGDARRRWAERLRATVGWERPA